MNIVSYNTFLLALARAGMYEQAEVLLQQMQANNAPVRPDIYSYNTVLLAYSVAIGANDRDVGEKADALIRTMINGAKSQSGCKVDDKLALPPFLDACFVPPVPNAISFNSVITTWSEQPNANEGAKKAEYLAPLHAK
jgi:pentatricopeptide repeat protein